MPATIKDISSRAGVSIATVSKVLNGDYSKVSKTTKDRVLDVAKELNYRPNRLARSLVNRKSNMISLLIPDITNPYHAEFSRGVTDCGDKAGYQVILCNTDEQLKKETDYLTMLAEYNVAGIIVNGDITNIGQNIELMKRYNIPYVTVDNYRDGDEYTLYVDNYMGSYLATEHLIQNGHRLIAYIGGHASDSVNSRSRFHGYLAALEHYGINPSSMLVHIDTYHAETGYRKITHMLSKNLQLTAVVCGNDLIALGALTALREHGLEVPDDISLVGYDDIYLTTIIQPALTTVKQPGYELGVRAMQMLLDRIAGHKTAARTVCFTPQLVIRQSVRALE